MTKFELEERLINFAGESANDFLLAKRLQSEDHCCQ